MRQFIDDKYFAIIKTIHFSNQRLLEQVLFIYKNFRLNMLTHVKLWYYFLQKIRKSRNKILFKFEKHCQSFIKIVIEKQDSLRNSFKRRNAIFLIIKSWNESKRQHPPHPLHKAAENRPRPSTCLKYNKKTPPQEVGCS